MPLHGIQSRDFGNAVTIFKGRPAGACTGLCEVVHTRIDNLASSPRRGQRNASSSYAAYRRPDEGPIWSREAEPIQRRGARRLGVSFKVYLRGYWSTRLPGSRACDCVCELSSADEYRSGDTQRAKYRGGALRSTSGPVSHQGRSPAAEDENALPRSACECHVAPVQRVHSPSSA
ncbi:unnamed protein product [Trichogramma brassicae]|uniref:Uncharacterized protein n=1 Tax=Trichogramma brassicae TaxID=86971 RepID=A0A6H5J3S6_9HYME|nr:unnamed protein product [Trichogramma brassicae]